LPTKNLTWKNFNTEQVMQWRLLLEEYSPKLHYIKGENNIVADVVSQLDLRNSKPYEQMSIEQIAELYANDDGDFPNTYLLSYVEISHEQQKDKDLKKLAKGNARYHIQECKFSGQIYQLVVREDKIVLPKSLQKKAVEWYHKILCHSGETRTELTLGQHFCWKGMQNTVVAVCQKHFRSLCAPLEIGACVHL
jgi:Integrase zinc binding domain